MIEINQQGKALSLAGTELAPNTKKLYKYFEISKHNRSAPQTTTTQKSLPTKDELLSEWTQLVEQFIIHPAGLKPISVLRPENQRNVTVSPISMASIPNPWDIFYDLKRWSSMVFVCGIWVLGAESWRLWSWRKKKKKKRESTITAFCSVSGFDLLFLVLLSDSYGFAVADDAVVAFVCFHWFVTFGSDEERERGCSLLAHCVGRWWKK